MITDPSRPGPQPSAPASSGDSDPVAPAPDEKDWTWVLDRVCAECGFDATAVGRENISARLAAAVPRWRTAATGRSDVAVRPGPQTWSVLEYACHVRDVHSIFGMRARLILDRENPQFASWDQDETAIAERYWESDPAVVAAQLETQGSAAAAAFLGLTDEQWDRSGRRSNGSAFTMETLGLYYLHDVEHHLHDVEA